MIKLIITDLDGTLLDAEEKVPQAFFEQIDRLNAAGIIVAIASGRQYFNIKNLFEQHTDKLHFIGDNGALGYYQGELFHSSFMPWDKAFTLAEIGNNIPNVTPLISASENTYFEKGNDETVDFIRRFYHQCVIVDKFSDINVAHEVPLKVAYYDTVGVKENSLKIFSNNISGIVATQSNVNWLDIAPDKTNKGEALNTLQKLHNITADETIAFGDYHNDIEMMQRSKYSFAVSSAQEEVKDIAKYICPSNKEEGVITILDELLDGYIGLESGLEKWEK